MNRTLRRSILALVVSVCAGAARSTSADTPELGHRDWRPLDLKDASLKAPVVEKDADAEALFWEVHTSDEYSGQTYSIQDHYVRLKIFTRRGADTQGRVEIPFQWWQYVSDVRGRTIKADGTILELRSADVFERSLRRSGHHQSTVKAFSLPGVEAGAIVEYQWRVRGNGVFTDIRYPLQYDVPVRELRYFIKPLVRDWMPQMSVKAFHTELPRWDVTHDGFHTITLKNVPAFRPEPQMPPESEVRPWMLVYYDAPGGKAEKFWRDYAKELFDWYKASLAPGAEVQARTREVLGDATDPAQKLGRLYDYCRREIRRTAEYDVPLHEEQHEIEKKEHQSDARTLERKTGSNLDINVLFGSMAAAAGFQARVAAVADREDDFLDEGFLNDHSLTDHLIAVRDGERWRFFDPGSARVPPGMLSWKNEGLKLLVGDPTTSGFIESPLSPPDKSAQRRTGRFLVAEDGMLEGDVQIEQTGHVAADTRDEYEELGDAQRLERLQSDVTQAMPGAEVSKLRIENVTDLDKPLLLAYHVRIAAYAQRAGKRLIFQPALFERSAPALFAATERRHPVYFHYPWSEEDTLRFEMPPGYELDNPQTPAPVSGGAAADYRVKLKLARNPYTLIFERTFSLGGDGALFYGKEAYPVLKQLFDLIGQGDRFQVAVKLAEGP
jgi:hypothetical protein